MRGSNYEKLLIFGSIAQRILLLCASRPLEFGQIDVTCFNEFRYYHKTLVVIMSFTLSPEGDRDAVRWSDMSGRICFHTAEMPF